MKPQGTKFTLNCKWTLSLKPDESSHFPTPLKTITILFSHLNAVFPILISSLALSLRNVSHISQVRVFTTASCCEMCSSLRVKDQISHPQITTKRWCTKMVCNQMNTKLYLCTHNYPWWFS